MDAQERMNAVYSRLRKRVGTGVTLTAVVRRWTLRFGSSDFGELLISAQKGKKVLAFEYYDKWRPLTKGTQEKDLETLVVLAEEAARKDLWKDT